MYDGERVDDESVPRVSPPLEDEGCTGGNHGKEDKEKESDILVSSAEEMRRRRHRFRDRVWLKPLDDAIKIIDFGGATYDNEQHNSIINTR